MPKPPQAHVLMGISGCRKTSVGETLSKTTGGPFFDADDFHPLENIDIRQNLESITKEITAWLSLN